MADLSAFPITTRWPAQHPDRIQLYSLNTPNGVKAGIMLEETGLPYEAHLIDIGADDQKTPEFLSLNPNGKIPAILDPDGANGHPLALFESGAILLYLADKTGIVTRFSGPSNPEGAAWGDIRYLGVTADANTDVAKEFVLFSMNEGYESTLSIAPEGKFPVRRGDASDPEKFSTAGRALPVGVDRKAPLTELYDPATIDSIVSGLDNAARWGVTENQLALASKMINSQEINRLVRQYLDGERDAADTVAAMNDTLPKI